MVPDTNLLTIMTGGTMGNEKWSNALNKQALL